jgi:hypothetical protein
MITGNHLFVNACAYVLLVFKKIIMAVSLEDKVRRLLALLDEVERGFREEPDLIEPDLALQLLDRLASVRNVIADQRHEDTEAEPDDGAGRNAIGIQRQPVRGQQVYMIKLL